MAKTDRRRQIVLGVLVLAVVGAALSVGIGAGAGSDDPESSTSAAPASPTPTATPAEVTPEQFCAAFLTFVDANSEFTSRLDAASGEDLVAVARSMFALPTPLGMSPGARASLDQLVAGTLPQVSQTVPEVTVDASPDPANDAEPDQAAFDAYLQATCPA